MFQYETATQFNKLEFFYQMKNSFARLQIGFFIILFIEIYVAKCLPDIARPTILSGHINMIKKLAK